MFLVLESIVLKGDAPTDGNSCGRQTRKNASKLVSQSRLAQGCANSNDVENCMCEYSVVLSKHV